MNQILEKLMAVLPLVVNGSTEVINLAAEIKAEAQATQLWTNAHEEVFQQAIATAIPSTTSGNDEILTPAPEPPPAATPSASEVASALAQSTTFPPTGGLAGIICAFLLLFAGSAMAQSVTQVPNLITNNPSFLDGLKTMEQAVTSGTNWTVIGGYGHSLKGNNNLGFADVAYDFNDNVGVVVGYDALRGSGVSQYNSLKGGVTLKTQIYPLAWTGIAKLAAIEGQPFAGDLVATARDGSVGNIVTTGINFNVYSFSRYVVDVGAQYELRAGEGVFNGNYALIHAGISRSF